MLAVLGGFCPIFTVFDIGFDIGIMEDYASAPIVVPMDRVSFEITGPTSTRFCKILNGAFLASVRTRIKPIITC